jgi:hypothetical protein
MGRGGANAGPVDADQPDALFLGVDPSLRGNLPTGPGSAMQPEDGASLRAAELGETDLTILTDRDVAFQLRTRNSDNHVQSVSLALVPSVRLPEMRAFAYCLPLIDSPPR